MYICQRESVSGRSVLYYRNIPFQAECRNGPNFSTLHASPYTGNTLHIFGIIKLHTNKDEDCSHTMKDINAQSNGR